MNPKASEGNLWDLKREKGNQGSKWEANGKLDLEKKHQDASTFALWREALRTPVKERPWQGTKKSTGFMNIATLLSAVQ